MENIYSRIEEGKLLHIIYRYNDMIKQDDSSRIDLVSPDNFIQCSSLKMGKGKCFIPHKHIRKVRSYNNQIAQESWVVIRGKVLCIFYDINDNVLSELILNEGDISITLEGGHNYIVMQDNTLVYEYKTGPYEGQLFDKEFI